MASCICFKHIYLTTSGKQFTTIRPSCWTSCISHRAVASHGNFVIWWIILKFWHIYIYIYDSSIHPMESMSWRNVFCVGYVLQFVTQSGLCHYRFVHPLRIFRENLFALFVIFNTKMAPHYAKLSRAMRAPWVDRFLNNEIYCYPLSKKRCGPPLRSPRIAWLEGIVTSGRCSVQNCPAVWNCPPAV